MNSTEIIERAGEEEVVLALMPSNTLRSWPRFLSRSEAAAYVGVSAGLFDKEVKVGMWPPAHRRGAKGGRLTWDRMEIDLAADSRIPNNGHGDDEDLGDLQWGRR